MSDADADADADVGAIREALNGARGRDNVGNLFLHLPAGSKDGLKLIPVSEVAEKVSIRASRAQPGTMLAALRS
ncbi:hypothetical protein JY444_05095 [Stenotrophomonas maltophilia]|nr:hypothetical protein [Stenotrophomonas maltophilia]MBN5066833.1 hypothetical protein [Stenotrophomonas maltophilia]